MSVLKATTLGEQGQSAAPTITVIPPGLTSESIDAALDLIKNEGVSVTWVTAANEDDLGGSPSSCESNKVKIREADVASYLHVSRTFNKRAPSPSI
jgi:hypothetical protein